MNTNMVGNRNATRKLTAEDVLLIRKANTHKREEVARLESELSAKGLAAKFGVHVRTIEKVLNYETWRHVA